MTIKDNVKEMNNYDMMGNCVYVKDEEVWYRDFKMDMPLREFFLHILKEHGLYEIEYEEREIFDTMMSEWRQDGYGCIEGVLAHWYCNLVAMAEYRRELKNAREITREQSDFILSKGLEEERRLKGYEPRVKITNKDRKIGNITFKKGVHIYYCGYCNNGILPSWKHCAHCGEKIVWKDKRNLKQ